jgi:hypothetical protein
VRAVSRAGRDAVDAGITRLALRELRNWGGGQGAAPWGGVPVEAVCVPALRHAKLDTDVYPHSLWVQPGAHMRGRACGPPGAPRGGPPGGGARRQPAHPAPEVLDYFTTRISP